MEFTDQAGMPAQPPSPVTGDKWPTFWAAVEAVFPGICPDHARQKAPDHNWDPVGFIAHTLDQQEAGHSYPTKAPAQKRKRGDDKNASAGLLDQIKNQGNEFAQKTQGRREKGFNYMSSYTKASSFLLQITFPLLYVKDIETTFKTEGSCLYQTYLALREELGKPEHQRRFACKKARSKSAAKPTDVHQHIKRTGTVDVLTKRQAEEEALEEFNAIHGLYAAKEEQEASSQEKQEEEAERERLNEEQARAEGTMGECGCCFDDRPMDRMVYCTGDTPHYVCFDCAKAFVKNKIGMSQWDINCFAVEGCQGTFSRAQRTLFIDDAFATVLDRLEQEQVLRDAGIDNLAHCPFCPYAAEYPPVEVNKEFVCDNPDCGAVTCRLCKGPTHIPKSCEEMKSETAAEYARHQIEEEMTLALIRKCNKCKTPYLKSDGCNKIVCSKCATIQCYICQATIKGYDHFRNENTRCYGRLHEVLDGQTALEIEKAEKETREKILKENAHIQEQHLGFKFSATVQQEDEQQRARAQAAAQQANRPRAADGDNLLPQIVAEIAGIEAQAAALQAVLERHPRRVVAVGNDPGDLDEIPAEPPRPARLHLPQGPPRAEGQTQIRVDEGPIRAEDELQFLPGDERNVQEGEYRQLRQAVEMAEQLQQQERILQAHRAAGNQANLIAAHQANLNAANQQQLIARLQQQQLQQQLAGNREPAIGLARRAAEQQAGALAQAAALGHRIGGIAVELPQQPTYAAQNWPGQANPNRYPQRPQFGQPGFGALAPNMNMADWRQRQLLPVPQVRRPFLTIQPGVAGAAFRPANLWRGIQPFPNPPVDAGMGIPDLTLPQRPNAMQGDLGQRHMGMVDAAGVPIRGNVGMANTIPLAAPAMIPGLFQQPIRPPRPEVIDLTGDGNQQYLLQQAAAYPPPMGGAVGGL